MITFDGKWCRVEDIDIANICGMSDGGQYDVLHATAKEHVWD